MLKRLEYLTLRLVGFQQIVYPDKVKEKMLWFWLPSCVQVCLADPRTVFFTNWFGTSRLFYFLFSSRTCSHVFLVILFSKCDLKCKKYIVGAFPAKLLIGELFVEQHRSYNIGVMLYQLSYEVLLGTGQEQVQFIPILITILTNPTINNSTLFYYM